MALLSRNLLLCTPEHVSARTLRPEGKGDTVVLESERVQQMLVCRGRYGMMTQIKMSFVWSSNQYGNECIIGRVAACMLIVLSFLPLSLLLCDFSLVIDKQITKCVQPC
jgi:hypothetical protein